MPLDLRVCLRPGPWTLFTLLSPAVATSNGLVQLMAVLGAELFGCLWQDPDRVLTPVSAEGLLSAAASSFEPQLPAFWGSILVWVDVASSPSLPPSESVACWVALHWRYFLRCTHRLLGRATLLLECQFKVTCSKHKNSRCWGAWACICTRNRCHVCGGYTNVP